MKIGVDIDNVIADSHPAYLSKFKERFGDKVRTGYADFYHIEDYIDADSKDVIDFLNISLHTDEFQITINPVANASLHIQSWMQRGAEIVYISARPESIRTVTTKWLEKHGFWRESQTKLYLFDEAQSYSDITYKSDIVINERVSLFIEDKKDIAEAITIPVILFDRPWNRGTLPSNITRVSTWDEIDSIVRKMFPLFG